MYFVLASSLWLLAFLSHIFPVAAAVKECVVRPGVNSDDAIEIRKAFADCGQGGRVVFLNQTYHVNSVMNTTGLRNVEVLLNGTLLWSTDLQYWLDHSLPLNYQNQTSAWYFGGRNVTWKGFGVGTLDGNGQAWYDLVKGQSNYPNRPHAITIWETYDSVFEGLRFVQSQMWTMTIKNSKNVLLQDIYVNSTSHNSQPARNTDGADTMFASNITFRRWDVDNGDDAISIKANSSDIYIYDSVFRRGQGVAIGSIGQYPVNHEHIENVYASNITVIGTRWAGYIKTWTGVQKGYPPNGGGGGLGYMKNIVFQNFTHINTRGVFQITQCTSFSGQTGDCDTSHFQISDLHYGNHKGTTASTQVASLQCSAAVPCPRVEIKDIDLKTTAGAVANVYNCKNVVNPIGFKCS